MNSPFFYVLVFLIFASKILNFVMNLNMDYLPFECHLNFRIGESCFDFKMIFSLHQKCCQTYSFSDYILSFS